MGILGKPRISEGDAALRFVHEIVAGVNSHWHSIVTELGSLHVPLPDMQRSSRAQDEFTFACIAVQMRALQNLLPLGQAGRIRECVIQRLSEATPHRENVDPVVRIEAYESAWIRSVNSAQMPWMGIAEELADSLRLDLTLGAPNKQFKSPILLSAIGALVINIGGAWWKTLLAEYKIVA